MIEIRQLTKVFKLSKKQMAEAKTKNPRKTAVDHLDLTAKEGEIYGRLHRVPEQEIERRRKELFTYFGIQEFAGKKIKELSTGMKQKAAIAVSLVHDPDIIIFDEPTNGLDIITARCVTDYLKKLRDEGKLVIVSTHIMSEAEKLCDRIGIIIDGSKVAEGTLEELLTQTNASDLEDAFFEFYKDRKGEA